jgi:hypothetical protein
MKSLALKKSMAVLSMIPLVATKAKTDAKEHRKDQQLEN